LAYLFRNIQVLLFIVHAILNSNCISDSYLGIFNVIASFLVIECYSAIVYYFIGSYFAIDYPIDYPIYYPIFLVMVK